MCENEISEVRAVQMQAFLYEPEDESSQSCKYYPKIDLTPWEEEIDETF